MAVVATDKLGLIKDNLGHVFTYLENLERGLRVDSVLGDFVVPPAQAIDDPAPVRDS